MAKDVQEIVHELRFQMAKRAHGLSMKTLGLAFEVNSKDHTDFTLDDFEGVLHKCGLFLKRQDLTKLFRYFDAENKGRISFTEFLEGLQGDLSPRRLDVVKKAFQKLDKKGEGFVDVKAIHGTYNASKHPLVLSGQKTEEQVLAEFVDSWRRPDSKTSDGVCTLDDFTAYYRGVSASVPDDHYFIEMMERVWDVKETGWDGGDVSKDVLSQIESVLREKVRQKAKGNEADTLRRAFKKFDGDDSNLVDFTNFLFALEQFGIVLDAKVANALFLQFDITRSGRLDYKAFVSALYQKDPLSASFRATATARVKDDQESKQPAGPVSSPSKTLAGVLSAKRQS